MQLDQITHFQYWQADTRYRVNNVEKFNTYMRLYGYDYECEYLVYLPYVKRTRNLPYDRRMTGHGREW